MADGTGGDPDLLHDSGQHQYGHLVWCLYPDELPAQKNVVG